MFSCNIKNIDNSWTWYNNYNFCTIRIDKLKESITIQQSFSFYQVFQKFNTDLSIHGLNLGVSEVKTNDKRTNWLHFIESHFLPLQSQRGYIVVLLVIFPPWETRQCFPVVFCRKMESDSYSFWTHLNHHSRKKTHHSLLAACTDTETLTESLV